MVGSNPEQQSKDRFPMAVPNTLSATGRCDPSFFSAERLSHVGLVIVLCLVGLVTGCGKKALRSGMPFDLDKVFANRFTHPQGDWKEKGVRLAKDKDFPKAIEAFMHYVEKEPQNFFGFNAIAVCYKNVGDHSNAMKNYERALEFAESPGERAKVLANIGNLYSSADKPQVALGYYKEAAKEFAENPLYLIYIAQAFMVLEDNDRASKVLASAEKLRKDLEKYESDDDNKGLGSYLMARCYAGLGDEEKLFQHLKNALKANPERYVARIEQDVSDEKNLLYTLKDDKRLTKLLQPFRTKIMTIPRKESS
jgi:tetratricopeptide (TPR) repeat protein